MEPVLENKLNFVINELKIRHFYVPDGVAETEEKVHWLGFDRLLIVLSGKKFEYMSLCGKVKVVEMNAGDALFIGREVWEYADMTHPHELLCIVFNDQYLRVSYYNIVKYSKRGELPQKPEWHHTNRAAPEAMQYIFKAMRQTGLPAAADLIRATVRLALEECRQSGGKSLRDGVRFPEIRSYVISNAASDISRTGIARIFGLHPNYVSKLFRENTGHTFADELIRAKMNRARSLLKRTHCSIKEIAAMTGFSSSVYFVRRFRELYGITPRQFRILESSEETGAE